MNEIRPTRHIVRATGIIGAASIINIAVGMVRTKLIAVTLGAAGVGRIGLLISLMTTAAAAAAWGIGNTGARSVAGAGPPEEMATARRALAIAAIALALVGAAAVYALRIPLARWLLGSDAAAPLVGWTAIGVGCSVIGFAQNGLLTGLKRVGDLARVSAASAVIVTALSVPIVLFFGEAAIVPYVLLGPIVTVAVGAYFIGRLPRPGAGLQFGALAAQWRHMLSLGTALTTASLAVLGGQLAIRVIVQHDLGLPAVGLFQASFAISVNYVGLALGALSTDYYPRLVPHLKEPEVLRRLVNGQASVSLLLAAPLIVAAIGFAPWMIALLYAPSFAPAAEMLRWQLLGDVLRIAGWPLSFVLLAAGRGTAFATNEAATMAIGVLVTALLVPRYGIAGAGIAYCVMYGAYLVSLNLLARRHAHPVWEQRTVLLWLLVGGSALLTLGISALSARAGMAVSAFCSAALAILALRHLRDALPPKLQEILDRAVPRLRA